MTLLSSAFARCRLLRELDISMSGIDVGLFVVCKNACIIIRESTKKSDCRPHW